VAVTSDGDANPDEGAILDVKAGSDEGAALDERAGPDTLAGARVVDGPFMAIWATLSSFSLVFHLLVALPL
jgi:hypothetical protein